MCYLYLFGIIPLFRINYRLCGRAGALVMAQSSLISYSPFNTAATSPTFSSKQHTVCKCICAFLYSIINMNQFPCLLLLLIWLLVQFGPLPRTQPLLLLLDSLLGVIDFGWQKRRSDMTLCNGLDPHHEKPAAVLWSQAVV